MAVGVRGRAGVQVPELGRLIGGRGRQEVAVRAVGGQGQHGVDVVCVVGLLALLLFLLSERLHARYVGRALAQNCAGVHAVHDVQVPELNIRVHGTDGREVTSGAVLVGFDIHPFDAERDGRAA